MHNSNKNAKILIIDDQPSNTSLLESFLKINGFNSYLSTNDSRQAQQLILDYNPDLILLDIMMPYVSGIDILLWMDEKGLLDSPTRVMVLTADITKETLKHVLSFGAHDMLRKPFDFVELELRIKNLLHANSMIKQLNDQSLHLAAIVDERTADLRRKNDELEQFIYVVSHDTQEPLRMITGFLQLLEKKYTDQLDEKGRQYIHYAVDGASRMKILIKDMLEFSRAGRLQVDDLETIDLNEVLEDILLGLRRIIDSTGADITFNELPKVLGFQAPVRQVIQNILINAMTYQPEGQHPKIEITSDTDPSGEIRVYISDNGIGIAEEHQKKIFDVFTRLNSRDKYPGSGVGLSISKKLMERLGGSITLSSSPGAGSNFCLHFPIKKRVNYLILPLKSR